MVERKEAKFGDSRRFDGRLLRCVGAKWLKFEFFRKLLNYL